MIRIAAAAALSGDDGTVEHEPTIPGTRAASVCRAEPCNQAIACSGATRCCPVNDSSTIGRVPSDAVHAILAIHAPPRQAQARIPTIAWTSLQIR
jgi:hypothetical protein